MRMLLQNGRVFLDGELRQKDLGISGEGISIFDKGPQGSASYDRIIDCKDQVILPGFADVHVHFREPGFSYKEKIQTGAMAGARGGYTAVCTMPNLNPPPATLETLMQQLEIIERDSCIHIVPYGTITMNQDGRSRLSDMEEMAPYVCAFTDDGRGVQTGDLMEDAMKQAKALGKIIVAHCEDESLLVPGGCIHDGEYARIHNLMGISSESEWRQVDRDLDLAAKTGCAYHVCHVSTKESVGLIRQAKKSGVDVTCETAPHYLLLSDMDLLDEGRFKMNPPIRSAADREALKEGLVDGTVDMIATDHAPHSPEEKSRGLQGSPFGIVGLEIAFPLLYTNLVMRDELFSLEKLVDLMAFAPRRRFNLPGGAISEGVPADITVVDLNREYLIDSADFVSMGKATPFDGWRVQGQINMTIVNGVVAYER